LDAITLQLITITNERYINAQSVCQLLLKLRLVCSTCPSLSSLLPREGIAGSPWQVS
jgi:hypothetical protein